MKKILPVFLLSIVLLSAKAQNFLTKVPVTASVVIKYSGANFTTNLPVQKLDAYNFIKHDFFKLLHIDTLTSLQHIGIDFGQDIYQYFTTEDSSMNFITMLHLNNVPQFLQLIKGTYKAGKRTEKKNGFDLLTISDDTYIGWNETTAIIVHTTYQDRKSYYDYLYSTRDSARASADSVVRSMDSAVAMIDAPKVDTAIRFTPPVILKDKKTASRKIPAKPITKGTKAKAPVTAKTKKPINKTVIVNENYETRRQDSIENIKREVWEQQQDMMIKKKQQSVAEKIITNILFENVNSIENEVSYKKIIDPAAHISAWVNTESLTNQYFNYFSASEYYFLLNNRKFVQDTTDGYKSSVNLYFDKDKLRIEQKTYAADTRLSRMGNEVMNSKQNPSMANYVNPGNIGYFSMSINTEAMANYYYPLLKKMISNSPYMGEYSDIVDVYIDLLEIIVDEKGIADLMPGNYLFVMHDLKTRMVTYTDYDFDKEFNKKEIKKTKKELSPDFTFIMETKKEGFMEKIAKLPLKYAKKGKFNYKDKGGYYELAFDEGDAPMNSLYFMVKDGKAIVTTSKEVVDMTLNHTGFAVDADTKNAILNNNYSLRLNSQKLVEQLSAEFSTDTNKKIADYLKENLGDIKMESGLKNGMIQGTTTMGIKGNHSNSLEFFFNMIDTINSIIEKDRQDKEKIIN
jgi:hypothetical protein